MTAAITSTQQRAAHSEPMPPAAALGAPLRSTYGLVEGVLRNTYRLVADVSRDGVRLADDAATAYHAIGSYAARATQAWQGTPRFTRIVRTGAALIARMQLLRLKAPWQSPQKRQAAWDAFHIDASQAVYDLCIELRGGVLKLGQLLACRGDLLPTPWITTLAELQDQAPAEPSQTLAPWLETALGQPVEACFRSFAWTPIAAASLAQVHRAELHDGTPVAVKIQRPGIDTTIEADIAALKVVATMLTKVLPWLDAQTWVDEIGRSLREELDFAAEAEHLRYFRAALADCEDMVVPAVHSAYSSERLLTMELIEGAPLKAHLDSLRAGGDADRNELDRLFGILVDTFCRQILVLGVFHADPHPGNLLVDRSGRLVLLDFGCVQTFPPDTRDAYVRICMAALSNQRDTLVHELTARGFRVAGDTPEPLADYADLLLAEFRAEGKLDFETIDPQAKLNDALALTRHHPVTRVPPEFVMLGRVFTVLGGLVMDYRPSVDLAATLAPYLFDAATSAGQAAGSS